jgi:hypothetical protein
MVETYETNLSGRTFDLSGPAFYHSVCEQYPQHALVVLYDRGGRLVTGRSVMTGCDGIAPDNMKELAPGGVYNPGYADYRGVLRVYVGDTLVATVKTHGAGSSVWIPVLCDDGRYFIGDRACPVTIE